MMGRQTRSESLFYYFRLEDQVPENHLLRVIDRHVSSEFVHEKLRDTYSETGRPSIDPEVLLRIFSATVRIEAQAGFHHQPATEECRSEEGKV